VPLFRRRGKPRIGRPDDDALVSRIVGRADTVYQRPTEARLLGGDATTDPFVTARIDTTDDARAHAVIEAAGDRASPPDGLGYVTGMLNPFRAELAAPGGMVIVVWLRFAGAAEYRADGPAIHLLLAKEDEMVELLQAAAAIAIRQRKRHATVMLFDDAFPPPERSEPGVPLGTLPVPLSARPLSALTDAILR
jgi:hypothetical protein